MVPTGAGFADVDHYKMSSNKTCFLNARVKHRRMLIKVPLD